MVDLVVDLDLDDLVVDLVDLVDHDLDDLVD
jgi:hypothetical protein